VKSAQKSLERYLSSMQSSDTAERYKEGINGVTESPMAKAAAAKGKYLSGVQAAVSSGRYEAALNAVPLSTYKSNAIAKADRLASGAMAASSKQAAYFQRAAPVWQQIRDTVSGMPKGTKAAAMDRVSRTLDLLATLKKGGRAA